MNKIIYHKFEDFNDLCSKVSDKLIDGQIVAWFQGRSEFGPRALGNRSILANPMIPDIKSVLNERIKFREWWRPYAPIVLEEYATQFFDMKSSKCNAYMLLSAFVNTPDLPGITHEDGTARIQTINIEQNERMYKLLSDFCIKTGFPVLLNTSFNVAGEPITESPKDAMNTFMNSNIDILVMGNYYIKKGTK